MDQTIPCPNCGTPIALSDALITQIQQELTKQHKHELETVRKQTEERLKKTLEEQSRLEREDMKKQLSEQAEKVRHMQEEELKLREERRKLLEEQKAMSLEIARKVDEERKKIEETVLRQSIEEHRLKDLEKDKKLADMEKLVEELKRKSQQGSQQLQGEVAELDFESKLREAFPTDTIEPVAKGARGADIKQTVRTIRGNMCGVILWELKRTKAWSDEWITKLKEDARNERANSMLIVSSVLPPEANGGFGMKDGVVVSNIFLALSVADLMRQKLIDLAREKFIAQNRGGKAEELYEYITSHEFRQQIEAVADVYHDMHMQIARERAAFEKIWKTREAQVQKLFTSTAGVIGSIRGKVGQSLPIVKGFELVEGEEPPAEPLKLIE